MQAFCVADEDTVRGFRLAGVPGEAVATPRQAAEAFARARQRPGCALLLLGEAVCAALGDALADFRATSDRPLVVELPASGGSAAAQSGLSRLLRSVVGAHLEEEP